MCVIYKILIRIFFNFCFKYFKIIFNSTIEKNILFIDIGYSKTSFILSKFKYNEFKVLYVKCYPYIGGRNSDKINLEYCINKFISNNNINKDEFELTSKNEI